MQLITLLTTRHAHLYEDIVVLHHQRADVDVLGERVVAVGLCAHRRSARDVLHICHMGRDALRRRESLCDCSTRDGPIFSSGKLGAPIVPVDHSL